MSGKANNAGIYNFDNLNAQTLYIKGKRFEDYITELVFEDQLEQAEITEIKLLLEYLDTTGLNSAWLVNNGNTNETLRASIVALQTKLANINTSALTETSVLTNDNRNSVLKTAIDTAATDLTSLTTRVTTAETDIDNLETKTRFITEASITGTGNNTLTNFKTKVGPAGGEAQGIVFVEHNMKNAPSGELIGYQISSNFTDTDNVDSNESTYSHYDGRLTLAADTIRVQATDQVRIGTFAGRDGFSEMDIKIGGRGNKVNIGSVDSQNATGPITEVWIGHDGGTTGRNSEVSLEGNLYIGNGYFPQLDKSSTITIASLIASFSTGFPGWVIGFFSGAVSFPYSDVWTMKGASTGNKKGDVATSNSLILEELYVINKSVLNLTPKVGFFMAKADYSYTALIGDHRTQVFEGDIVIRNNNISSSSVAWAFTEADDKCNVVRVGGDNGILIHQGASDDGASLRIINSCNGSIKMSLGDGGTKAATLPALEVMPYGSSSGSATRIGFYPETTPTGSQQLEVNQPINRDGIVVQYYTYPDGAIKNIINYNSINTPGTITGINLVGSTSVSTPSIVISGNYTGNTTNRLYKNADNKLFWNGVELGANLGGGGGGLEYYIPLASNVTNPAPNPTAQIATETYTNAPQRTITQSTTATGTGLRMARYLTSIINKDSNPFVEGVQTIQQYLTWSENNTIGQLYGQIWLQAEATGAGSFVYERTYSGGVAASGPYILNGTPIPVPNGLFNLSVNSVVFPNINIVYYHYAPDQGPLRIKCRLEGQDLVTENWNILQTSANDVAYTSNYTNETLTFNENFIRNQTTKTNAPIAYRFVLFVDSQISPNITGQISQSNSGSTNSDQVAYKLGSVAGSTASIRILLYDGESAKQTIAHTTTPSLVPIELPISPPYQIGAFNNGRLGFDVFMYQPSGAVNTNHQMRFFFGEGTISHIETTINEPPAPIPTLASILNSGATASQPINMDGRAITGITTLEGSSGGNWNVKQISAGTGVSVSPTSGTYTIANTGVLSVASGSGITATTANGAVSLANTGVLSVAAGSGITATTANGVATLANTGVLSVAAGSGISATTANGVATLANTGVLSVAAGSGISATTANGVATLANTGVLSITQGTGIAVSTSNGVATISSNVTQGSSFAREQLYATNNVGVVSLKPSYYMNKWSPQNTTAEIAEIFVSQDGRNCAYIADNGYIKYSSDYGATWNNSNLTSSGWRGICGSSTGKTMYVIRGDGYTGSTPNIIFTSRLYASYDYGATWAEAVLNRTQGTTNSWYSRSVKQIRCSADGLVVAVSMFYTTPDNNIPNNGTIYVSTDGSKTWTIRSVTATASQVADLCMSANGAIMFAAVSGILGTNAAGDNGTGGIYRSYDYGTTWARVRTKVTAGAFFWGIVKCDATARFLVACELTNDFDVAPAGQIQTSEDFGEEWKWYGDTLAKGASSAFVSSGGNLMITIHNPQYNSRIRYTQDYGRSWSTAISFNSIIGTSSLGKIASNYDGSVILMHDLASTPRLHRCIEEKDVVTDLAVVGGTLAKVGGVYTLTNDYALHYAGMFTGNVSTWNLNWDVADKINLETHNIKYEIFISYNYRATQLTDDAYYQIGLNGVSSTQIGPASSDNRRRTAVTNWTDVIVSNWSQGTSVYNQSYIDRFYCGYRPTSTWSEQFRNRVHLTGEISMNRRLYSESETIGIIDYAINSRIIVNQFHCETFVDAGSSDNWYVYVENGTNNAEQHNRISGTAIWNARAGNLYEANLETGISEITLFQQNLTDPSLSRARPAEVRYRIWKVKKNI